MPAEWRPLYFGRHVLSIPDSLWASYKAEIHFHSLGGLEHGDRLRTDEVWAERQAETRRYVESLNNERDRSELELLDYRGIEVEFHHLRTSVGTPVESRSVYGQVKISSGTVPIIFDLLLGESDRPTAERVLERLASSVAPGPPKSGSLCTPAYAFSVPPEPGERVSVELEARAGHDLWVESFLVDRAEPLSEGAPAFARKAVWFSLFDGMPSGTPNAFRGRRVLRVAGMLGTECVVTTSMEGRPMMDFIWVHRGTPGDPARPYMIIYFSGNLDRASKRELRTQWKAMLGSLRSLG